MRVIAVALAATLLAGIAGGAAITATAGGAAIQGAESYAGVHVEFEGESDALTNYTVDDRTYLASLQVQSKSTAEGDEGVQAGTSLANVTDLEGSDLSVREESATHLEFASESGATVAAHDNEYGILVVGSENGTQFVRANVTEGADTAYAGGAGVTVEREDGGLASFIVVGDGEVDITDDGNVAAEIDEDDRLVVRHYEQTRRTADRNYEAMIVRGTTPAEVFVMERDGGHVVDVVTYDDGTTVDVEAADDAGLRMDVERDSPEGAIVLTSFESRSLADPDAVNVTVDGERARRARTYSQLRTAATGGEEPWFMAIRRGEGTLTADVTVAVEGFSTRSIAVFSDREAAATPNEESAASEGSFGDVNASAGDEAPQPEGQPEIQEQVPGFGVGVALAALAATVLALARAARR